ncbi:uncharacterized protein [Watersipora subatra]|uniref:uncharacterized protein isoform X1 n=1 Tax=Watersipora subatra TaxID=2589382 RepID=UPI00355B3F47
MDDSTRGRCLQDLLNQTTDQEETHQLVTTADKSLPSARQQQLPPPEISALPLSQYFRMNKPNFSLQTGESVPHSNGSRHHSVDGGIQNPPSHHKGTSNIKTNGNYKEFSKGWNTSKCGSSGSHVFSSPTFYSLFPLASTDRITWLKDDQNASECERDEPLQAINNLAYHQGAYGQMFNSKLNPDIDVSEHAPPFQIVPKLNPDIDASEHAPPFQSVPLYQKPPSYEAAFPISPSEPAERDNKKN